MSIFSKIKGAKKAANEHKASIAKQSADAPAPYRHIPTHAAIDALSGAPSSWREEDRSAIKAQHKRRSMMTRNDSGLSNLRRNSSYNNSTYSNSTYHGSDLGPIPPMPMRRSYVGASPLQPSPLAIKRESPVSSEANSTSSSSSQIMEMPYTAARATDASVFDSPHKNPARKIGEAPLLFEPLPTHSEKELAAVEPSAEVKKRAWAFGKHKAGPAAIAAH
ncbi:hypothetical protein MMC07_004139 [Pseudocyphellaria aurata]|nr:hypothetical protein [Pseudocyphellaria aurata]